jgi:hypothetical protein
VATLRTRFHAAINEKIEAQSAMLSDDRCASIEQYRRACGIIYGLRMSLEEFDEVLSKQPDQEETENTAI